jgi:hypothetical protein
MRRIRLVYRLQNGNFDELTLPINVEYEQTVARLRVSRRSWQAKLEGDLLEECVVEYSADMGLSWMVEHPFVP